MKQKKQAGTQLTEQQRMLLAAVLGGTNLGMSNPSKQEVSRASRNESLDAMIYSLWSGSMDSDEMEKGFLDECRWWFKDKQNLNNKRITVEYIQRVWPDIHALVFQVETDQHKALNELRLCDHAFLGKDQAEKLTQPFGFKARTWEHKASPNEPKGLTLANGATSAVGVDASHLAIQICDYLKLKYVPKFGRGSQLRSCCDAIQNHLDKNS
jgi:hypothetical protein